jgi:uncharacterized protein
MKSRSIFRGALWTFVALALVFHIAGGWYFSGVLIDEGFTPAPASVEVPTGDFTLSQTSYSSPLGAMDAWRLEAPGSLWVVHVHGLNATPSEGQHLFSALQRAGYQQLSITYRNDEGQPADPSGLFQYGVTEWEDIKGALEYATSQGATGVVFLAYSTGASHVLSYAYRNQIDDIRGFIFDSPNIDLGDTVAYAATQRRVPLLPMNVPVTLGWTAKFFTSLRIGVNWKSLDYVGRADSALRVRTLVLHGTEDLSVPLSQSVRFAEAAPTLVTLRQFPGAGHLGSYDEDPAGYTQEILGFLDTFR